MTTHEALETAFLQPGLLIFLDGSKFGVQRTLQNNFVLWKLNKQMFRERYIRSMEIPADTADLQGFFAIVARVFNVSMEEES